MDVQTSRSYITDSMEARAATGNIIGEALVACEPNLNHPSHIMFNGEGSPGQRLPFGSTPTGAAFALVATSLFDSSAKALEALVAADPHLPLADKASTNGFSPR